MPASEVEKPPPKITYTISIFTMSQMKKDTKKRGDPKNFFLQLSSTVEWDTFKAQLLEKISSALKPPQIHFDDYNFTFHVPRHHKTITELSTEADYVFLTGRALKATSDPVANITIEPIVRKAKVSDQYMHVHDITLADSDFKQKAEKENLASSDDDASDESDGGEKEKEKEKKKKMKKASQSIE